MKNIKTILMGFFMISGILVYYFFTEGRAWFILLACSNGLLVILLMHAVENGIPFREKIFK